VRTVLDVRLRRTGQLAGFAKDPDLAYFLRKLARSGYESVPHLAPTEELLAAYRAKSLTWDEYAAAYRAVLDQRRPERIFTPEHLDQACLLCSEHSPRHCHRRLAAEYLRDAFASSTAIEIVHL